MFFSLYSTSKPKCTLSMDTASPKDKLPSSTSVILVTHTECLDEHSILQAEFVID